MTLDMGRLKGSLAAAEGLAETSRLGYFAAAHSCAAQLAADLPALSDDDRAAVAFYIAEMFAAVRQLPVWKLADVLENTAVGYSLAAAILLGMTGPDSGAADAPEPPA